MSDLNCPYCNEEIEINYDDGFGVEEDVKYEQECPACEKHFVFTTSILIQHEAHKADCMNDGNHKFKPIQTWPKYFTKMRCSDCDVERDPTEEERVKFGIPNRGEGK